MAWRRGGFIQIPSAKKRDNSACDFILSVVTRAQYIAERVVSGGGQERAMSSVPQLLNAAQCTSQYFISPVSEQRVLTIGHIENPS